MTTTTGRPPTAVSGAAIPVMRVTQRRVLAAEALKFRSLRSTR